MNGKWIKAAAVAAALVVAATACGDDDDDSGASATTGANAATTGGATTATTAGSPGTGTAAASDNPHTSQATSPDDYLTRLDSLLPEAVKYTDPVPQVSGNTTQGITDTTIKIGSVTAMTNQQGVSPFPGMCEGMMARIELENSKGGVKAGDGKTRKFEFAGTKDDKGRVCQDDKSDRDLNRQKIHDLVEGDKVFALLPVTSDGFFNGDYLTDKHIPYFGQGYVPDYCGAERPFAFGSGGAISCDPLGDHTFVSTSVSGPLFQAMGVDPKTQQVAIVGSSDPSSITGVKIVQLGFEATGAKVVTVDNGLPPNGAPLPTDFTPFVSAALAKNPTVVSLVINYAQVEPMAKGLRDAGYKGTIQQFVYEDERLVAAASNYPGIEGTYVGIPAVGSPVGDVEGVSDVKAALLAAGFPDQNVTVSVLHGWATADMLIAMIQATPAPLTTENLANTVNAGWHYEGYGKATCPSSWPLAHYIGPPCIHVVQVDLSGALGATNGLGLNGGKGGLLPKVDLAYGDLLITAKPK